MFISLSMYLNPGQIRHKQIILKLMDLGAINLQYEYTIIRHLVYLKKKKDNCLYVAIE